MALLTEENGAKNTRFPRTLRAVKGLFTYIENVLLKATLLRQRRPHYGFFHPNPSAISSNLRAGCSSLGSTSWTVGARDLA